LNLIHAQIIGRGCNTNKPLLAIQGSQALGAADVVGDLSKLEAAARQAHDVKAGLPLIQEQLSILTVEGFVIGSGANDLSVGGKVFRFSEMGLQLAQLAGHPALLLCV
jgi:hypothetical protein